MKFLNLSTASQLVFILFCIFGTIQTQKLRYRPVNTAVFKDEPAILNCSAINPNVIYERTNWILRESQGNSDNLIATDYSILPIYQDRFKFPDDKAYHLNITKVDQYTAGLYECVGFANGARETYYHAFLSVIDKSPKCASAKPPSNDYLPDKKIAYCHTEYAGFWPPTIKIKADSNIMNFAQYTSVSRTSQNEKRYSTTGACALINQDDQFTCLYDFHDPPYDLITGSSFDNERPNFKEISCDSPTSDDADVPQYLKENCLAYLKLADKDFRPTNKFVRLGSSADIVCKDINKNNHTRGIYTLTQSQTGEPWVLTESFVVFSHLENLFQFPNENEFNLKVLQTTSFLTGKYGCSGFKGSALTASYSAFLLALEKPNCRSKKHANLGQNQNLAFCFADYAGNWAPRVEMTQQDGSVLSHPTFNWPYIGAEALPSKIGSCALVTDDQSKTFRCSMMFESPPDNLITDSVTDKSAPPGKEDCSFDNGDLSVPAWLLTECEKHYNIQPEPTQPPSTKPQATNPSNGSETKHQYNTIYLSTFLATIICLLNAIKN